MKLQTLKHNSETENMEVHHHPDLHHEKKKFREYFLEFLMIFFAVSMGFIAESLREHMSEHIRAKEYAVTMLSDLKSDTVDLNNIITYYYYAAANVDTLMQLLSVSDPKQIRSGKLYWYGLFGGALNIVAFHDATLLEMKSSGTLRYFSNPSINRDVSLYDQLCQSVKTLEVNDNGIYIEVRKARAMIFDFKYNDEANAIYHTNRISFDRARIDSFLQTNPPLLSYDRTLFNQYVEMVRSRNIRRIAVNVDTVLHHATALIGELENEYDLNE
jgi:hypothetical protein